jgi:hypothetical protein
MATLKNMTRVGADVRQIARLLQAKAPENHMLAYITPEEAQLLKNRGGTGMPDPDTGIPTYYVPDSEYVDPDALEYMQYPQGGNTEVNVGEANPIGRPDFEAFSVRQPLEEAVQMDSGPQNAVPSQFDSYSNLAGKFGQLVDPYSAKQEAVSFDTTQDKTVDTTPSRTIGERYSDLARSLGVKEDTLSRIGLAGLQVGLGARQARLAKEEARKAKEEQQRLAAPYQTKGAELQRQAQAGELTPAGQQSLQTVQAQAAQAASSRGGVGAQQTAARVEAIRSQLLQQQYDYGLKLSGIGDQILLGSIRTGLEADRYVNQLSNTYFTNVARTLAGSPTVIQYGVPA